jgi:hypothetical protein
MFVAPAVTSTTLFRFELNKNNGQIVDTVDVTVVPLAADDATNTTFIDRTLSAGCSTYDPTTRLCGSGGYTAMNEVFQRAWNPAPISGRRYVFRGGTYPYTNNNPSEPVNHCWNDYAPIVLINGINGTPSQPVQFKAYKDPVTGNYETPVLDATGMQCSILAMLAVDASSYVIVEGFTVTGATFGTGTQRAIWLGLGAPVHHVTVRHMIASHNGFAGTSASYGAYRGAFYLPSASHEVLFDHVESFDNGTGIEIGGSHITDVTQLPYNVWLQYVYAHDNVKGGGNSSGVLLAGTRNSIVSHAVLARHSDGGGGTQGPFADDTVWEYIVSFLNNSALSTSVVDGNQRGLQIGNVNPALAYPTFCGSTCYAGSRNSLIHHVIAYNNQGNGVNDPDGSHNGRYYHMSVFNNCLAATQTAQPGIYGGLGFESKGGAGIFPTVTIGATLKNNIVYHNIVAATNLDANIVYPQYTTQQTNLFSIDPKFVVATPAAGVAPALTTDTALYAVAAKRTPNPDFGIVAGLKLQAESAGIDRGTFIPGFHCVRADDGPSPYPANDPNCVHWRGSAPDIGAFEYDGSQAAAPPLPPSGLTVR